jgi:hypothetical protein
MRLTAIALGAALCLSCGSRGTAEVEAVELAPELEALVVNEVPSDIPRRSFIDFGGKIELIGYGVEPEGRAPPGSTVKLRLFWRSTQALGEGYVLDTYLLTPRGRRVDVDATSPLRAGMPPSKWQPGRVYLDEVQFSVPAELEAPRFSIAVAITRPPLAPADAEGGTKPEAEQAAPAGEFSNVGLRVLSGVPDARQGAILTSLETGVTPGASRKKPARSDRRRRARDGAAGRVPAEAQRPAE